MDDKRIAAYSTILNFPTEEEAREHTKDIATSLLLGGRQVGMFITQALTNPKIKEELLTLGFTEKQIPNWVGSEPATNKTESTETGLNKTELKTMKPAGKPLIGEKISPAQPQSSSVPAQSNPVPVQSSQVEPIEVDSVEQAEIVGQLAIREQGGPQVNPTGSEARAAWVRENNLLERDGKYWRNVVLKDGRMAMVAESVPEHILREEATGSTRVGEQMYKVLEGATDVLIKKVALNPDVFNYFFWLKSRGYLNEKEDIADFLNYSVKFYMKHAFGVHVAMVVDERDTILHLMRPQNLGGPRLEPVY